jgi:hypothetical protein
MFDKKFEDRLRAWHDFRATLSNDPDPIQSTIDFWNQAPETVRNIDPYDHATWPDPWQMIEENSYCEYTRTLAIAYTLKLTDRFIDWQPVFKVGIDKDESRLYYMCIINDSVLGVDLEKSVHITQVPKGIHIQKIIELPTTH